jgi:hypothetical protein
LKGSNVGAQTLTVVATSSKGASATVSVAIRVAKFTGAKTRIASAKRVSGGVRLTGSVTPPSGVTKPQACKGAHVSLTYGSGSRTVTLTSSCGFSATVLGHGTKARAAYRGSAVVAAAAAVTKKV